MTYQVISSFKKTTDASGGALQLHTNNACHRITIRNYHATELVYLGDSSVSTTQGFPLLPGESITLQASNANKIYYINPNATSVDLRVLIELEA